MALLATLATGALQSQSAIAQDQGLSRADESTASEITDAIDSFVADYNNRLTEILALQDRGECRTSLAQMRLLEADLEDLEGDMEDLADQLLFRFSLVQSALDDSGFTDRLRAAQAAAADCGVAVSPAGARFKLSGAIGYGEVDLPGTGIGFRRDGPIGTAPEEFAVESKDRVSIFEVSGDVRFRGGYFATGSYSQGDSRAYAEVPSGTDSGIVYGELSPGGSSGIAAAGGLSAAIEEDYESFGFGIGYDLDLWRDLLGICIADPQGARERCGPSAGGSFSFKAAPYIEYSHVTRKLLSEAQYAGAGGGSFVVDFSQTRDQHLRDTYLEAGIIPAASWSTPGGISLGVEAVLAAYRYDSKLESIEENRNNVTGPPDENFIVTIRDDADGWGFRGGAGAFVSYEITPRVLVGIRGRYDYRSDVGTVFNPSSGDQVFFDGLTTALEHRSAQSWSAAAVLTVSIP